MNQYKIFQIGLNKCGTLSLCYFFSCTKQRIKSIHWDGGKLAKTIMNNISAERYILSGYDNFRFFSDMECCFKTDHGYDWFFAYEYFEELDKQCPGSKFILNTRNVDSWIKSRLSHKTEFVLNQFDKTEKVDSCFYSERFLPWASRKKGINLSKDDLVKLWKDEREEHHEKVLSYFKGREQDLLVFDLDCDGAEKIANFFPDITFLLKKFPLKHKTISKKLN